MTLWQKSISAVEAAFQEARLRVTGRTVGAFLTSAVAVSGLSGCAVWDMPLPNAAPPTIYYVVPQGVNQPKSHCDGRFAVRDSANCHRQDWQDEQRRQQEEIQRERQEERERRGWQSTPQSSRPQQTAPQQYTPPARQQAVPQQQRQQQTTPPPTQPTRQRDAQQPYGQSTPQYLPGQR